MNVSLPDAMKTWVEAQTEGGRYANASDYVRDLIRHDRERREAIAELQALMDEGIARGEAKPWNIEEFLAGCERSMASGEPFRVSKKAGEDLEVIWRFTLEHWSLD